MTPDRDRDGVSSEHATVETTTVPTVEAVPDRPLAAALATADLQVAPAWSREEDTFVTDPDGPDEHRADAVAEALLAATPPGDLPNDAGDLPGETPPSGVPLPPALQAWAERVTSADLHAVRLHRSAAHDRTAASLGAGAFTLGHDVVLGTQVAPLSTAAGLATLAHELGHVVAPPADERIGRQAQPPPGGSTWTMRVPPQDVDVIVKQIPAMGAELNGLEWNEAGLNDWTPEQIAAGALENLEKPTAFVVAAANYYVAFDVAGSAKKVEQRSPAPPAGSLSNQTLLDLSTGVSWVLGDSVENGGTRMMGVRQDKIAAEPGVKPGESWYIIAVPDVSISEDQLKRFQKQAKIAAATAAGPPGWSRDQAAKLRKRQQATDKSGSGGQGEKGSGTGGGGDADVPSDRPLRGPAKLEEEVGADGSPLLKVTVDRARTWIGMREGESTDDLEKRVDQAIAKLQESRDPANSVAVLRGGATETGFPQQKGDTDGVEQSGETAEKQVDGTALKTTPGEQVDGAKGGLANAPEYPSKLEMSGLDPNFAPTTVRGATNEFTMKLDYAARSVSMQDEVFNRLQDIQFYWEIIKVDPSVNPTTAPLIDQKKAEGEAAGVTPGKGAAQGAGGAVGTNFARDMNAIAEDQEKDLAMMSEGNWSWEARAAYLGVIGISNSVRMLGSVIKSFIDILTQPLNARSIGFDHDGDYIIRCVATPVVSEKARADPAHHVIRKSSVAVKPIRVQAINDRAVEAVGREEANLRAKEAAVAAAQAGESESKKQTAQADLDEARKASKRGGKDTFDQRVAYFREQVRVASALKKHKADRIPDTEWSPEELGLAIYLFTHDNQDVGDYLTQMQHALESMTKSDHEQWVSAQAKTFVKIGDTSEFRPRIVLASEETGQVSDLLCMLGQLSPGPDAPWRWALVDITSPGTRNTYVGRSALPGPAGRSAAIRDAFRALAEEADYGRGTLAIRMPQELTDAVGTVDVESTMRSAPGDWNRVKGRLSDLARVAGIAAFFLTGGAMVAVGAIGGIAGAIVSVDSLVKRSRTGHVVEGGTIFDIIGVIGGAASVVSGATFLTREAANAKFLAYANELGQGGAPVLPTWVRGVQTLDKIVHVQGQVAGVLTLMKIPYDLVEQWGEIDKGGGSEGEKRSRKLRLLLHSLEAGTVTVVGMRGGLASEPTGRPAGEAEGPAPKSGEQAPKPPEHEGPAAKPPSEEATPVADIDAVAAAKALAAKRLAEAAQAERETALKQDEEVLPDENGRTAQGTTKGPREPASDAVPDKNSAARDVVLATLEGRVGKATPVAAADVPPPRPGEYGQPTKVAAEAVAAYDKAVGEVRGKREIGIFYNPNTGEFQVMVGTEHAVRSPGTGDGWQALVHLHPNPENVITFRLPAPADIEGSVHAAQRNGSHVEYVQSTLPDGTTMLTKVTVTTKPLRILVEMPGQHGEPPRVIDVRSAQEYVGEYNRDARGLDPTSQAFKWLMADLDAYYARRRRDEGRTGSGTLSGPPEPALTPEEIRSATEKQLDQTQRQLERLRDRAKDPREKAVYTDDLADLAKLREEHAAGNDVSSRLEFLQDTLAVDNKRFAPVEVSDVQALADRTRKAASKTKKKAAKTELMRIAAEADALAADLKKGKKRTAKADPRETYAVLRDQELRAAAEEYSVVIDLNDAVLRKDVRDWLEAKAATLDNDPVGQLLFERILEHIDTAEALTLQQSPRGSGRGAADTATMRKAILEAVQAGFFPADYVGAFDQGVKNAERFGHTDGWPRDAAGVAWEVDHIAELWLGGGDDITNYLALPKSLHDLKSRVFGEFMGKFRGRRVLGEQTDVRETGGIK